MWMYILSMIAFMLLVAYVLTEYKLFGLPVSISNSFYLYEDLKKGLGYVFTAFLFVESFLILIPMIAMSNGHWYQFIGFLAPAGILFCGAAPETKSSELTNKVHVIGACTGAIGGLIWCLLSTSGIMIALILLLSFCITALLAAVTSMDSKYNLFWAEIFAFGSITLCLCCQTFNYAFL